MMDNLPSLEEYKDSFGKSKYSKNAPPIWSEPKFKCPKCGGNVRRKENEICPTIPPKHTYKCDNPDCDYVVLLSK